MWGQKQQQQHKPRRCSMENSRREFVVEPDLIMIDREIYREANPVSDDFLDVILVDIFYDLKTGLGE